MNDVFGYTGVVDITDGISSIRIKNSGGVGVAELFTRAVLGYPSSKCKPTKVDIVLGTESTLKDGETISDLPSILFEKVPLKTCTFGVITEQTKDSPDYQYNNWKYPILDILISADNINITDYSTGRQCTVILYNDLDQVFASIEITIIEPIDNDFEDDGHTLYYHQGNNVLIRWYMYLTNREIIPPNDEQGG